MMRAMRNRYLARSEPGIGPHTCSYARRAAATARSTSASDASEISESTSSDDGLIDLKLLPVPSTKSPSMNKP
jgi:hypothetical protein